MRGKRIVVVSLVAGLAGGTVLAQQSVVDSAHDLSVTGPGQIRAAIEPEVCVFCHTPHKASAARPLWNRGASGLPYTVYESSTLDADVDQPTGASKMCLSCHDGSIAIGSVVSRDQIIQMAGSITTLPPGTSNLGTDLSDDHPVSFAFNSGLVADDPFLIDPHALPPGVSLDGDGSMQCTTCHDPHDDSYGNFLAMDNTASDLCLACHRISDTTIVEHLNCRSCHQTHSAPSGPFLLVGAEVRSTCLSCHDGSHARAKNILADLGKVSVHDTYSPIDPEEAGVHAQCTDCHEPHTMRVGGAAAAPSIAANFGDVSTDLDTGRRLAPATYEYEVCFKCHGDENVTGRSPHISRQITQTSTRLQFDPSGPSFHPVVAAGRNHDVPSLRPGWTEGSRVLCSDCHGSDTSRKAGGSGPNGIHGSNHEPILLERYETTDYTPESTSSYALCYRCHERDGPNGILGDRSFPHRLHVVDERTPCSVCHDAHGISSAQGDRRRNSHLINFDTSVVFPDPVTGRMEFDDMGTFSGSCTLSCHGAVHSAEDY